MFKVIDVPVELFVGIDHEAMAQHYRKSYPKFIESKYLTGYSKLGSLLKVLIYFRKTRITCIPFSFKQDRKLTVDHSLLVVPTSHNDNKDYRTLLHHISLG